MRIAHFSDSFLPEINGVAVSVDEFSREQAKRHQVRLYVPAYSRGKITERRGDVDIKRYYSVPVPTVKTAHLTVPNILDIYKSLVEFDPDVIHFHTPGTMGMVGILLGKIIKCPLVGTYHTLFSELLDYVSMRRLVEKYLAAIDKAASGVGLDLGLLRNGDTVKNGESTAQKLTWSAVNRIFNYADVIICPTAAVERELVKRKIAKSKLEVISNGLDIQKFAAKRNYHLTNKLLHVGRLGFEKNTDVAIKAFAKVAQQLPKLNLVIVGDGPARKELEKLAGELGIKNKVKFTGMMRRDKLPWIFRNSDMFVTASDMETLGLVVLEAMASGIPVVAVSKYAMIDLVAERVNGFRVEPGDAEAMAKRIYQIETNEKLRSELGRAARETAEKQDLASMVLRMETVYKLLRRIKN